MNTPTKVYRVVVDVEVDCDKCAAPWTWDWSELLDAPAFVVDVDEVAPIPRR